MLLEETIQESCPGQFEITLAERWADAEKRLETGRFDVVLLDLSLPDSSGQETISRAQTKAASLPIVVLTGLRDEAAALQALRDGVQDYLVKGQADGRQTARAIRYAIERKREEMRLAAFSELGRRLSAAHTPREAAEIILETADALVGWDACELDWYAPEAGRICPILIQDTSHGRRVEVQGNPACHQPSALLREVIERGPKLMTNAPAQPSPAPITTRDPARPWQSALVVPIRHGPAVGGIVSVLSYAGRAYAQADLRILQSLANQCGGALERIRAQEALRQAKEELASSHANLERIVEERTAKLRELVSELEHFSYSITHDMRAPLRAMKGFSEVVTEMCSDCGRDASKDFLRRIMVAADRMDCLIKDALNYNQAVQQELKLEPVDVAALLRGMLDSYPELHAARGRIHISPDIPCVIGNQAGLTQCFSNLLSNALKFVQPGKAPEVVIRAEQREDWVRLWFEDEGIGIPEPFLPRVFDMFARGHRAYAGTGIGLALVRKVVARMGGMVGVQSQEGQGSRFWLDLRPVSRTHPPNPAPPDS